MTPAARQSPAALDLIFYQDDTEAISVWLPMDLAGVDVRLQVRDSRNNVLATLISGAGLVVIPGDLPPPTPDNPTPTQPHSRVDIAPTLAQRAAIVGRSAIYDLQTMAGSAQITWLRGRFIVEKQVTA